MKRELLTLLLLLLPAAHSALAIVPCGPFAQFVRDGRALLIFAPSHEDPRYTRQVNLLYPRNEPDPHFADYQLSIVLMPLPYTSGMVCLDDVNALRQRFHIAPAEFTVILLGKDGGEKLRTTDPVTIESITQLIDTMPMRQQEVKDRH